MKRWKLSVETPPLRPESRPTDEDEALAVLARALGHPARVRILRCLMTEGACICGQIVVRMPLAQATVSQHLKILKDAGWIEGSVEGPRVCYCIKPEVANRFMKLLEALAGREKGEDHEREK